MDKKMIFVKYGSKSLKSQILGFLKILLRPPIPWEEIAIPLLTVIDLYDKE